MDKLRLSMFVIALIVPIFSLLKIIFIKLWAKWITDKRSPFNAYGDMVCQCHPIGCIKNEKFSTFKLNTDKRVCPCHPKTPLNKMKIPIQLNYDTTQHRKTIRHYNRLGHAHFLTFSCYKSLPFLDRDRTRSWLTEAIGKAKEQYKFSLWAYVIMPEHVHLLVYPSVENYNISLVLKAIKQSVARRAKHYLEKNGHDWLEKLSVKHGNRNIFRFWQAGSGYDRNVTSKNELLEKIHYMHNNPVRRGLVQNPEEWKWSSAGWYNGERDVILAIDEIHL